MQAIKQSYPIEVFTATRYIKGIFEPTGALLAYINDPDNVAFYLTKATFTLLEPTPHFRPVTVPELMVCRNDILFFYFEQAEEVLEKLRLLKRVEQMIVYTPAFAIRGDFHLGAEQQPRDMFDTMKGDLQAMTDVTLFPLIRAQVQVPSEQKLIFINKQAIQLYHPAVAE